MNIRILIIAVLTMWVSNVSALTMEQFSNICNSAQGECSEHPILQAYVGGALDLLATLHENTGYLENLYCKQAKELFDVPTIIRFMQTHKDGYASRNAMLLVVSYFEEKGGCQAHE